MSLKAAHRKQRVMRAVSNGEIFAGLGVEPDSEPFTKTDLSLPCVATGQAGWLLATLRHIADIADTVHHRQLWPNMRRSQ